MQTTIGLTFQAILAEEQFSLDELVLVIRKVVHEEGMPGLLRLILELMDEYCAINACRHGKLPGPPCCQSPRWEIKDRLARQLRDSAGVVPFKWRRLLCRACGKHLVPMRHWLRLDRWQSKTGELERIVVETVTEQSYRRSTNHLEMIGVIPVPKSTAHRWVAQTSCDQLNLPERKLPTVMVDGTGFKRRPNADEGLNNKGELRVVIGLDEHQRAVPIGTWSGQSWEQIAAELEAKTEGKKLGEQLSCDGEPGLAEALSRLVNSVQRCHWHMTHDLDRMMWFDKAPLTQRRQEQKKLAAIIGIELPKEDFEHVKSEDKQQLEEKVRMADCQLDKLVGTLQEKGYGQAATYIASAQKRLFGYISFWMRTGVAAARTTSYLERLMRELGRRLKKIAFGWSEAGAAKMARILIRRICGQQQWIDYWKNRLGFTGKVLVSFRGAKVIAP